MRGYKEGRFSFNVKGGRCETCAGEGFVKIEMQFLPDVYIVCDMCKGKRYNRDTLEIEYKGKNIADVLEMTVTQAMDFFDSIPHIKSKLKVLNDVGLGYIRLGQSATTLSGGEAQRIKLSRELSKRDTGQTLYILDEPTTGLHFVDIDKLLFVLNELIERGNTVVVIEHNMDVIKCADYLIDLGPEGGDKGGETYREGHAGGSDAATARATRGGSSNGILTGRGHEEGHRHTRPIRLDPPSRQAASRYRGQAAHPVGLRAGLRIHAGGSGPDRNGRRADTQSGAPPSAHRWS